MNGVPRGGKHRASEASPRMWAYGEYKVAVVGWLDLEAVRYKSAVSLLRPGLQSMHLKLITIEEWLLIQVPANYLSRRAKFCKICEKKQHA